MTKEEQKEAFQWLLLTFGFLLVVFIFLIYFGGICMKPCFVKIICISLLIMAFSAFIICAFCCNPKDCCPPFKDCIVSKHCILNCNTGFAVVHSSKKSYTVTNYDSFEKAFEVAVDGDVLYVFEDELSISEQKVSELFSKANDRKDLTLKIIKNEKEITVHLKK